MRSFIIHMPGTQARAANVAHLLQVLPQAEQAPAVDGRDPAQIADVLVQHGTRHRPFYPFEMGLGEIGCFLSHRRCWARIADGDAPFALIAEDDLVLDPKRWQDALALIHAHAGPESFIRLPAKQRETPAHEIAQQGAARLILPRHIGLQTICQVVGRNAAQRMLAATETLDRPVDTTLQMHWITQQPVHSILNAGVSEQVVPSTIQKKTSTSGKLMREIRRALYRARLKGRPQRA